MRSNRDKTVAVMKINVTLPFFVLCVSESPNLPLPVAHFMITKFGRDEDFVLLGGTSHKQ